MQYVCDPELLAGLLSDLAVQALHTFRDGAHFSVRLVRAVSCTAPVVTLGLAGLAALLA